MAADRAESARLPSSAEGERRESIKAKEAVNKRWSYADDRRLIQLAASSKSVNAIADEMNRPPETVVQMALRFGISPKSAAELKAKTK